MIWFQNHNKRSQSVFMIVSAVLVAFDAMQIENYWNTENGTIVTYTKSLNITSK